MRLFPKGVLRSSIFQLSVLFSLVAIAFFWYVVFERNYEVVGLWATPEQYAQRNVINTVRHLSVIGENGAPAEVDQLRFQSVLAANPTLSYYYEDDKGAILSHGGGARWRDGFDIAGFQRLSEGGGGREHCVNVTKSELFKDADGWGLQSLHLCGQVYEYIEVTGLANPVIHEQWSNLFFFLRTSLRDSEPYYYIAFGIFGAIAVVLFGVFHSLRRLARLVDSFNPENKSAFLPKRGTPLEAEPLIDAFNNLLTRVNEYEERRDFFLATAAHEIRTPLAVISAQVEELPESTQQQKIFKGVRRLSTLSKQLISLVKSNSWRIKDTPADVVAACRASIAFVSDKAETKDVSIEFQSAAEDWFVIGDQSLIELAITNVLHNAINFSPHGGRICVELDDKGVVMVRDQGPGVDSADAEGLFEPFQKNPDSHAGHGLGLAIVRAAVDAHNGDASIFNSPEGGAQVRLSFQKIQ